VLLIPDFWFFKFQFICNCKLFCRSSLKNKPNNLICRTYISVV